MIKKTVVYLGKLALCGLCFVPGIIIGGMAASLMGLTQSSAPEGTDTATVFAYYLLTSPLLALVLSMLSRRLAGGFAFRALTLSFLTWTVYGLNTALEASVFMINSSVPFTAVVYAVPSLFCGISAALLFRPGGGKTSIASAAVSFFKSRKGLGWIWRLAASAIAFAPVYILFGMIVYPFTGEYYEQNMYGLKMAGWDQILPVLFIRSVLFLFACLPVIISWRGTRKSLFLILGSALFVMVGLLYMLSAYWIPVFIRAAHSMEIMADSFVYAGLLTLLLSKKKQSTIRSSITA